MINRERDQPAGRVCVIGAGPCGLAALKNMRMAGIHDVVCYDEGSAIGGNWVFDERPDRRSVYEVAHLISSKMLSEFDDFPFPKDYPDFPSHRQMRSYFESYARHFGLLPMIRLQTRVVRAALLADGRWAVDVEGPGGACRQIFDYLVVCSGHHREPLVPDYPGHFSGDVFHSSDYKRPEIFKNQRVLVVGGGNSACDIAVDVARVAKKCCISMRRGYNIMPKLMFGRPSDVLHARLRRYMGRFRSLLQFVTGVAIRAYVGPLEKYGLQPPKGGALEMHPTLNSDILMALRNGDVLPRVGIESFNGRDVSFSDGLIESFDSVIWATGYLIRFSFLDSSVVDWDSTDRLPLYLMMMHRHIQNIFFIGLFQPIGCIWRLADHQARIAALQIKGLLARPDDINERIEKSIHRPHWHFDSSPRHAIEVDYHDFRTELLREIDRVGRASRNRLAQMPVESGARP